MQSNNKKEEKRGKQKQIEDMIKYEKNVVHHTIQLITIIK